MRRMAWRGGPTGVEERRHACQGVPRNLGDPVVSTEITRSGIRVTKALAWEGSGLPAQERTKGRNGGSAKRRQRSAERRVAGSPSAPYDL